MFAGCASSPVPYGPAFDRNDFGYSVQAIESNRFRVSYRGKDATSAQTYALRRAAEVTVENRAEWFRVVNRYAEQDPRSGGRGSSISIGGGTGSGGMRGGVGLGVGIGFPLGGQSSIETTESLEIITGSGPKPADAEVYDARSVLSNLATY